MAGPGSLEIFGHFSMGKPDETANKDDGFITSPTVFRDVFGMFFLLTYKIRFQTIYCCRFRIRPWPQLPYRRHWKNQGKSSEKTWHLHQRETNG